MDPLKYDRTNYVAISLHHACPPSFLKGFGTTMSSLQSGGENMGPRVASLSQVCRRYKRLLAAMFSRALLS